MILFLSTHFKAFFQVCERLKSKSLIKIKVIILGWRNDFITINGNPKPFYTSIIVQTKKPP
tara:strand:- start:8 stop:190 length:183 start_codon:yes stop_codon:yes gene_type:complete